MFYRLVVGCGFVLGAWLLTGCGENSESGGAQSVESAIEAATAKDTASGSDLSIHNEPSKPDTTKIFTGAEARIPEGFPKDVPLFGNRELIMTSSDPATGAFSVQARSTDSAEDVQAWYLKELPAAGWTETPGAATTLGSSLRYTKDNRLFSLRIGTTDAGTTIFLSISTK